MRFSQNFLVDQEVAEKISLLIDKKIRPIIEVGCGKGFLSEVINPDICIEIDPRLLVYLGNYNPIHGDGMRMPVVRGQVVSSLPYSITFDFFEEIVKLDGVKRLVLVLQEDFTRKVMEYPTYISFLLNYYYSIRREFLIPPSSFKPPPKVLSSLLILERVRPFDSIINEKLKCISRYRNKTVRRAGELCGLVSTETRRIRDFKPQMVGELLNSLGLNSV